MVTVELFTKPDCSLCEEAKEILLSVRKRFPFHLTETVVGPDQPGSDRYRVDIPVIHVNGVFFARHSVSGEALLEYLRALSSSTGTGS